MCGNGAVIGMAVIHRHHKLILPDRHLALTACFVGVVGAAARGSVVWLSAATTLPTAGITATASASPSSSYLKKEYKENKKEKNDNTRFGHRRPKIEKGRMGKATGKNKKVVI